MLMEKALQAEEGEYIVGEEADEQIEQLGEANGDMVEKVTSISKMVTAAIRKARDDQCERRRMKRNEISKIYCSNKLILL